MITKNDARFSIDLNKKKLNFWWIISIFAIKNIALISKNQYLKLSLADWKI